MFVGRNISTSHLAFATTRVMATCGVIGQAVGTAAALAVEKGCLPRTVGEYIAELQKLLIEDDCFLPKFKREMPEFTAEYGDPSNLQNGVDRKIWGNDNGEWETVYSEDKNHQHMITGAIDADTTAVRLIPKTTYFS